MKFQVIGAEIESGKDVQLEIAAVDTKQAEDLVRGRGIMISSITPVKEKDLDTIELEPEPEHAPLGAAVAVAVVAPAAPAAAPPADAVHERAVHVSEHPHAHMEYKLLQNQALFLLEKTVNKFLADGWEPAGGLTVAVINNAPNYFQAIKRKLG